MEEQIAQSLKQNIPQSEAFTPAAPDAIPPMGVADVTPNYGVLDELTSMKLASFFNLDFSRLDETVKQQMKYVYAKVAEKVGSADYPFVVAAVSELQRMIGVGESNQKLYKTYQWLKLDSIRKRTEQEMVNLGASNG